MANGSSSSGQDPREGSSQDGTYHYKYTHDTRGQEPQDSSKEDSGTHYQYKYSYGSGKRATPTGGSYPPKSSTDWGEWVGIAFLFLIPLGFFTKMIAVIWLITKLSNMDKAQKARFRQEAKQAAQRAKNTARTIFQQVDAAEQQRQASQSEKKKRETAEVEADPWDVPDSSESRRKRLKKKLGSGRGLIIAGSIVSGIFALGSMGVGIDFLRYFDSDNLIGLAACLMFMAGGLSMLFSGIGKNRAAERYLNYLSYIGSNQEVDLAPMAASFGISVNKLCKDLRKMLAQEVLPTGYLDLAEGKLYLTQYRSPGAQRTAPPREETPQQAAEREDTILREIRQINDEIPDEVMSAKIDRIEEITGKILKYQKEHPNKEGQLRTFLNYYLPTTLKILRAYAQLDAQGIEGENISAAKKRIEDMMDQVVSGFEKQLDKLFQDDAMDITTDVEVLENMLKKDGLSDEGGITMTL